MKGSKYIFRNYEAWALVTGAASGMGRLYALKLASRGYNLILADINAKSLTQVREEILAAGCPDQPAPQETAPQEPSLQILTVVVDLGQTDAAAKVMEAVGERDVEVLVNNAGIMYFRPIAETSRQTLSTIMLLHNYTPLMLCREFVPRMQKRGCGYILNISSLGAWMTWPGIGMYAATKRFVKDFSRSLRIECTGTGVSVTNAYFGAVDTPLIPLKPSLRKLARNLRVMIDADIATDKALKALFRRRKGTMPGALNKIFLPLITIVPDWLLAVALRRFGKYLSMDV